MTMHSMAQSLLSDAKVCPLSFMLK